MSEKSTASEMSAEVMEMIENKRRLAIEKRNQRQTIESNKRSFDSLNVSNVVSNTSTSGWKSRYKPMTSIKTKEKTMSSESSNESSNNRSNDSKETKTRVKATIRLISNKRFEFDFSYNADVVHVCRGIDSRSWDPNTKRWTFDIKDYKKFINELKTLSVVEIEFSDSIPDRVMNALIAAKSHPKEDIDLSQRLSPELMEKLFTFQVEGVIFGVRSGGRCLIADDMGLGKTLQAIGIALWFRDDWPLLIVCPSTLRFQWEESIREWMPTLKESEILVVKKVNEVLPQIPITIISYDLMARMRSQFSLECRRIYNFVVLDESHYIKSDSAARTEAIHTLAKSSKHVILLTGTPALSRPMELFTQIKLINPKLFSSKHEFGVRYCDAHLKQFWQRGKYSNTPKQIWDYKGAKNLDELKILLESTILVRRLKTDVLKDLSKKRREMIIINVDHMSEKNLKKLKEYSNVVKKLSFNEENTSLFDWYMDSALAKVEPVCHYLEQLLNKDMKVLCFCHHKQMLDGIEEVLAQKRINHIRIDGSTHQRDRRLACKEFQTRPDCRVALLSITACATGLNLTSASVVVFAELFWNPGILSQAEDRVHRIGQQKDVVIYYLVAKNTIDDMIWPMISKKLEILNKAGLSKDNFAEASTALDAFEAEQQLITDFFSTLSQRERQSFNEDIIE